VFAPSFYNAAELRAHGVDPNTIVWFRGFHTCYLKGQRTSNANPFLKMGYKPPIVLVRPEPEFASFFGSKEKVLEETVSLLSNNGKNNGDFTLAVFPRTESQLQRYKELPVAVINDAFVDNPIAYADLAIGAAETMLMEAFVLGKPAISTVYWDEAKPLKVLHRYIPHTRDPKEAATQVLKYLDPKARKEFQLMAEKVVSLMDNPIAKVENEINRFYDKIEKRANVPSKRRSQIEIYAEIIRVVAFKSMKLTHVMQEVNLSYAKVKNDLDLLKKKGLIEEQARYNEVYSRATLQGLSFLNDYEKMKQKLP
jgi:predicted transcriptional regulator